MDKHDSNGHSLDHPLSEDALWSFAKGLDLSKLDSKNGNHSEDMIRSLFPSRAELPAAQPETPPAPRSLRKRWFAYGAAMGCAFGLLLGSGFTIWIVAKRGDALRSQTDTSNRPASSPEHTPKEQRAEVRPSRSELVEVLKSYEKSFEWPTGSSPLVEQFRNADADSSELTEAEHAAFSDLLKAIQASQSARTDATKNP